MQRAQLTLRILFYAAFDVVGMIVFATGALWLAQGQMLFFKDFPSSLAEAVVAVSSGLLLMIWAASRILREITKRPTSSASGNL